MGRHRPIQVPALSKADAQALLAAIAAELSDDTTSLQAARDNFIFTTALLMAPRSAEMLRLEAGDLRVEGDPPVVQLFGKFRRHGTKRVPSLVIEAYNLWTTELASALGRDLRPDDALLVPLSSGARKQMREHPDRRLEPMSRAALYCLVRERFRDAEVTGKKLGPHRLRKTAATLMFQANVDVETIRRALDHADVSTTFRNYIVPAEDLLRAAGDEVDLGRAAGDEADGR